MVHEGLSGGTQRVVWWCMKGCLVVHEALLLIVL